MIDARIDLSSLSERAKQVLVLMMLGQGKLHIAGFIVTRNQVLYPAWDSQSSPGAEPGPGPAPQSQSPKISLVCGDQEHLIFARHCAGRFRALSHLSLTAALRIR